MSSQASAAVSCGLRELARHSAAGPHRDGWGIAYYHGREAHLVREVEPADESQRALRLVDEGYESRMVLAHIRHATQGAVALRNTQPFTRDVEGRAHVFAHNGDLLGIDELHAARGGACRPGGETDSERAFCVLLERVKPLWRGGRQPPRLVDRLELLAEFASWLRPLGPANFLYADGDTLFVHGHRRKQGAGGTIAPPGLHLLSRPCPAAGDDFDAVGLTISAEAGCAVLAASVPLSDEPWEPLAEGELVAARGGRVVERIH